MSTTIEEMKQNALTSQPNGGEMVQMGFGNLAGFELMQRAAKLFASSSLVPNDYRGNVANCTIALNMANRLGADPLMVMQNLYVVHGRPGWSSQFLIGTFNQCGRFSSMRFEFFGERGTDAWGCRAQATELSTGHELVGTDVTISIAKREGWYSRNGSKWQTMPQQMLIYRAAAWFVRAYAPELSMGLQTSEELGDVYTAKPDGTGAYVVSDLKDVTGTAATAEEEPPFDVTDSAEAAAQVWPQKTEDGGWVDADGQVYDPEQHATGHDGTPSITKMGNFRARRGTGKRQPAKESVPDEIPGWDDETPQPFELNKSD